MSGSSYSTSLRFELQFTGENVNLWGDKLNATFSRVDDSIAGYVALAITGDRTLTSPNTNATADEARQAHLKLTGSPTVDFIVTLPSVSKSYRIWNATGKKATFGLGSGNTASIEAGDKGDIWSNGVDVSHAQAFGAYSLKDYIAASVLAGVGSLPALPGNAGKYLYTDAATSYWKALAVADLSDFNARLVNDETLWFMGNF